MAKGKGFAATMALGMMAGAALSVAAMSMTDARARRAVQKQAHRAMQTVNGMADELGQIIGK